MYDCIFSHDPALNSHVPLLQLKAIHPHPADFRRHVLQHKYCANTLLANHIFACLPVGWLTASNEALVCTPFGGAPSPTFLSRSQPNDSIGY